jgi:nitrogen fixation NifU-like protein
MSSGGTDDLYREVILDHYRSPRNQGRLDPPSVATRGSNPLCGDEVELWLAFEGGRIAAVAFEGQGCSISQASASLMTEVIRGKSAADATALLGHFRTMMADDGVPLPQDAALGDLEALQGVRRYPVRVRCALLAWNVLQEGLDLYADHANSPADRGAVSEP